MLNSALEDFERTTLGAVAGLLGKLYYLAELHEISGEYSHWGMGRVYGAEAARAAIRKAHAKVLAQVLRSKLGELTEDLRQSALKMQITVPEFLASLEGLLARALPEPAAASEKHLTAVLHVLSALTENPADANRQDASPLPPPVR